MKVHGCSLSPTLPRIHFQACGHQIAASPFAYISSSYILPAGPVLCGETIALKPEGHLLHLSKDSAVRAGIRWIFSSMYQPPMYQQKLHQIQHRIPNKSVWWGLTQAGNKTWRNNSKRSLLIIIINYLNRIECVLRKLFHLVSSFLQVEEHLISSDAVLPQDLARLPQRARKRPKEKEKALPNIKRNILPQVLQNSVLCCGTVSLHYCM